MEEMEEVQEEDGDCSSDCAEPVALEGSRTIPSASKFSIAALLAGDDNGGGGSAPLHEEKVVGLAAMFFRSPRSPASP